MDSEPIYSAFQQACEDGRPDEIAKLGREYLEAGGTFNKDDSLAYKRACKINTIFNRLQKAIQSNNDILIADIWRMNYEFLFDYPEDFVLHSAQLALERVHDLAKLKEALRHNNIREIMKYYDPVLYQGAQLFTKEEQEKIDEAGIHMRTIVAIEMALKFQDDRMLYITYPKSLPEIDAQFDKLSLKYIFEARKNINIKLNPVLRP